MRAKMAVLGGALVGLLGLVAVVLGTPGQAAAAGSPRWVGPYADGCAYYTDGQAAYFATCPRYDGTVGIVQAVNGNWMYFGKAWIDANDNLDVVLADSTSFVIGLDGSETIVRPDGTYYAIPANTGQCGDYCQPNFGGVYFPSNDAGVWLAPRTQPEYTPGCEHPVSGTCFGS